MTAPPSSSLIGVVEMPRGVGPTGGGDGLVHLQQHLAEHRRLDVDGDEEQGLLGARLRLALRRQRHRQDEIIERVVLIDLVADFVSPAVVGSSGEEVSARSVMRSVASMGGYPARSVPAGLGPGQLPGAALDANPVSPSPGTRSAGSQRAA